METKEMTEYVADVVKMFMNLTYGELAVGERPPYSYLDCATSALISENGIRKDRIDQLTYMDIICMVDNVKENENYTTMVEQVERFVTSSEFYLFECRNLANMLLAVEKVVIPVRMFLNLPFYRFYEYLHNTAIDKKEMEQEEEHTLELIYKVFRSGRKVFVGSKTIKTVLETALKVGAKSWLPEGISIEKYQRQVLDVHHLLEHILIKSFKTAYENRFEILNVLYSFAMELDDEMEYDEMEDDEPQMVLPNEEAKDEEN